MSVSTIPFTCSKWDERFFAIAKEVATWSKDPSKKVGAVLIKDKRILATGYNGFPQGIADLSERLEDKALKRNLVVHAELNAILNAGKHGVGTEGSILYVTFFPCSKCSLAIIQAGVSHVVSPEINFDTSWSQSQEQSVNNFSEAGVKCSFFVL